MTSARSVFGMIAALCEDENAFLVYGRFLAEVLTFLLPIRACAGRLKASHFQVLRTAVGGGGGGNRRQGAGKGVVPRVTGGSLTLCIGEVVAIVGWRRLYGRCNLSNHTHTRTLFNIDRAWLGPLWSTSRTLPTAARWRLQRSVCQSADILCVGVWGLSPTCALCSRSHAPVWPPQHPSPLISMRACCGCWWTDTRTTLGSSLGWT